MNSGYNWGIKSEVPDRLLTQRRSQVRLSPNGLPNTQRDGLVLFHVVSNGCISVQIKSILYKTKNKKQNPSLEITN